jgi:hypothetical protein
MAHPITPPPMMTASAFLGILIPHQGDVIILVIGLYHDLGWFRCQVSALPLAAPRLNSEPQNIEYRTAEFRRVVSLRSIFLYNS